jgi:hypothetical protein
MHTTTRRMATSLAAAALTATTTVAGLSVTAAAHDSVARSAPLTCAELWDRLPDQLQDDITAARSLAPQEQHRAMWAIRRAALRGVYGERVERLAEARRERRRELWAGFPEQLRQDLRDAWSLPFEEQRQAMRVIRSAALRGGYGEEVQALAEAREQWLSTCPKVGEAL